MNRHSFESLIPRCLRRGTEIGESKGAKPRGQGRSEYSDREVLVYFDGTHLGTAHAV